MRGQLDKVRVEREERIREDIRINGPKWIPEINRHFMDADNSTTDFGICPQCLISLGIMIILFAIAQLCACALKCTFTYRVGCT